MPGVFNKIKSPEYNTTDKSKGVFNRMKKEPDSSGSYSQIRLASPDMKNVDAQPNKHIESEKIVYPIADVNQMSQGMSRAIPGQIPNVSDRPIITQAPAVNDHKSIWNKIIDWNNTVDKNYLDKYNAQQELLKIFPVDQVIGAPPVDKTPQGASAFVPRMNQAAADFMTFGATSPEENKMPDTNNNISNFAADTLGVIMAALSNPQADANVAFSKINEYIGTPIAKAFTNKLQQLGAKDIVQKILPAMASGGADLAAYSGGTSAMRGDTPDQIADNTINGLVTGLAFGGVMKGFSEYALPNLNKAAEHISKQMDNTAQAINLRIKAVQNRNVKDLVIADNYVIRDPNFQVPAGYAEYKPGIWVRQTENPNDYDILYQKGIYQGKEVFLKDVRDILTSRDNDSMQSVKNEGIFKTNLRPEGKSISNGEPNIETVDKSPTKLPNLIESVSNIDKPLSESGIAQNSNKTLGIFQNRKAARVYDMAKAKQESFDNIIKQVSQENGIGYINGGTKSVESMINKVNRKISNDPNYGFDSIKDHNRSAMLLNDFSEVSKVIDSIKSKIKLEGEAFIETPLNNTGYRGIHLTTKLGDGINAEIQIHTKESWRIKKETDKIYDKWRDSDITKLSPQQLQDYKNDMKHSKMLWEGYFAAVPDEVKRNASASVIGLASINSPHLPLNGAQDPLINSSTGESFSKVALSNTLPDSVIENRDIVSPPNSIITPDESKLQQDIINDKKIPSQFQGNTPESEKLGIVPPIMRGSIPIENAFTYTDEGLEQQHAENRIQKKTVTDKLSEWASDLKRQATRTFREIEPNTENAEILKELIRYPKIKSMAADEAARVLKDIIDREGSALSPEEFNRFERYVFLNDLMEEIEQEHALPGLWTEENVKSEHTRVKDSLNDNVKNAVERRDQHMNDIKNNYIKAMADLGFNVKDKFKKKNYFRHQVLEYMNAKNITGSGASVNVNKNRGFIKQRHGSTKGINEDYLQAEYEVYANMLNDIETAKMLLRVEKRYSIKNRLKAEARIMNNEAINAMILKEKEQGEESPIEMSLKEFKKGIAIGFGKLRTLAIKGELWDGDGKYQNVVSSIERGSDNLNEGGKIFEYISKLIGQTDKPGQSEAALILKNVSGRKKFIKDTLGSKYATWETIIPEGYTTWQPIIGKTFFAANTITDKLAEALMTSEFKDLGASDASIKKMMVMGQNMNEFVLSNEIANSLDGVYNTATKDDSPVSKIISTPTKYWKGWVLTGNPRQVLKYNLRNLTGDLDGLIASGGFGSMNPKYVTKAAKELYEAMRYMNFSPELLEWRDKGGFQSLLYANEIADINSMQIFRKYSKESKASVLSKVLPVPKSYFEFTRNLTDYREGLMRYSAYLYFKDQIRENGGKPKTYGASNQKVVEGLSSTEDKAYQLSKDALGAYDEITELGQAIRKYIIPFYSWNEVNFKRYKRIVENAINDIKLQRAAGERFRSSFKLFGYISRKSLLTLGKIAIRITAISALLAAWNLIVMNDEEQMLPENIRNTPHITLGKNKKGEVLYFSRLGSLNDMLSWFGLDTLLQDIKDLQLGRKTVGEQVSDMVTSPFNKLINGITPYIKNPAELLSGKSLYPDIREPKVIRDPGTYIFNSLGLGEEYKRASGMPRSEKYLDSWLQAFVYKTEPKANAYYRILDLKMKFEKDKLGKYPTQAFNDSPKTEDLYYFKLSMKYGDKEAAKKYLLKYVKDGGTSKGLTSSLKSMSPIHGLDSEELTKFLTWLTPEEQKDLKKAYQYYTELIGGENIKE